MTAKDIVNILDKYSTPNTGGVEFPYYLDVARVILKENESQNRIFNRSDMIAFAVFAVRLKLSHPIFLDESHIAEWQSQYVESKWIQEQ